MSDFRLHTLGCGSAKPSAYHNPSCHVLEMRGNLFMIDCGEGAQQMFQRQRLKFSRLNHIFLTHLHGDHVFGLPGLIGTLALSGVGGDITVHTFEEGKEILERIFGFFNRGLDIEVRYNVIPSDREALVLETKSMTVTSLPLKHRVPAVGFLFEEKARPRHINREMTDFYNVPFSAMHSLRAGMDWTNPEGVTIPNCRLTTPADASKRYAHISDTSFMPELADRIGAVDLLYHETTYLKDMAELARQRGHSTAREAAEVARRAGAHKLLTGHYSSRYRDLNAFEKECREVFGNVIINREGLITDI